MAHDTQALLAKAMATGEVRSLLMECAFVPLRSGFSAAHNSALDTYIGPGWIAAGDAAISFDPISAQGVFHALFTGLAAAEAAHRYLSGDDNALNDYQRLSERIERAYWHHLASCYAAETRWSAAPFWRRRVQLMSPKISMTQDNLASS
jgi:flavin-dependent dehydrogenase